MDYLVKRQNVYQNPDKLPLNELYLKVKDAKNYRPREGEPLKCPIRTYPAIDLAFIDEQSFPYYQPYYFRTINPEDNAQQFIKKGLEYIEGLDHLLCLPYHQFWCYVAKHPNTVGLLSSYIHRFTRPFELEEMEKECFDMEIKIHNKVLTVLYRIFTYEQSPTEFMAPETVFQLLEKCGFMTYGIVVNMCTAFNITGPKLLDKVTSFYFKESRQHIWMPEVEKFLDYWYHVFEMVGGYVCGFAEDAVQVPIGLRPKPSHFDPKWYESAINYFLEALMMLNAILSRCVPMTKPAISKGIPFRLTYFYNEVFPTIYKVMSFQRGDDDLREIRARVYEKLARGREQSVEFINIIVTNILSTIVTSQNAEEKEALVETYLKLIATAVEDELFIFDYHNTYDINEQFEMLGQFYSELDPMQTQYITQYLESLPKLQNIYRKKESADRRAQRNEYNLTNPAPQPATSFVEPDVVDDALSEDEINAKIEVVSGTFPDLGDAFVLKCLECCDYDPVSVITLILDDNLPPHLDSMSRHEIRVPPEPSPEEPVLAYRGKKPGARDVNEILDDKTDKALKDIILKTVHQMDLYDDDYDDRDEYQPVVAPFARDVSESEDEDGAEEEDEIASNSSGSRKSDKRDGAASGRGDGGGAGGFQPFCEDPAKLREQREMAKRNFSGSKARYGNHDVVGRARGQGQDEQVLRNRDRKTVQKAFRGNHNRKRGAQWKASSGMY